MVDTKQSKTIGEHHAAAELARHGWAPALTRDGLERTDILAVLVDGLANAGRMMVEIQVKAARGADQVRTSWPLGTKSQSRSRSEREFFVMVAIPDDLAEPPRSFVVPRIHVAAAAWIAHMHWLTDPTARPGTRNADVDRSRVYLPVFERYEGRWDLLRAGQSEAPVLLPTEFRAYALEGRVGLPPDHEWHENLPTWD